MPRTVIAERRNAQREDDRPHVSDVVHDLPDPALMVRRGVIINEDFAPFGTEEDAHKRVVVEATLREFVAWIRERCGLGAITCAAEERARRAYIDRQNAEHRRPGRRLEDRQLQLEADGRHEEAMRAWLKRRGILEEVASTTMHADAEGSGRKSSASHAVYSLVLQVSQLLEMRIAEANRRAAARPGASALLGDAYSPAKILRAVYSHLSDCDAFLRKELPAFRSWRHRRGL